MKKIFILACIMMTTLFATESSAQIKFGLKGGLNVTSMNFSKEVLDAGNRTGFFIGPTVLFTLPVVGLGIDASAVYDQREAELKYGGKESDKLKTQAINIPINLRYGFGLGNTASLFFFAGPQFGFNVGDKHQSLYNDVASWRLSSSNFSVNVGAGVMLINHLQLSANYNIACGKTGDVTVIDAATAATESILSSKGRSNAWQISLAYYF